MRTTWVLGAAMLGFTLGCASDKTEVKPAEPAAASTSYQEPDPAPEGSPTVMLLDLDGQGVENAAGYTLFVRRGLLDTRKAFVVLKREQTELLAACNTEACMERLRTELSAARYLVSGGIGMLGESYMVRLKLIEPATGTVVQRVLRQGKAAPETLLFEAGRELGQAIP